MDFPIKNGGSFHCYVKIAIENGPVEIVNFPIQHGGSFHSFLLTFTRPGISLIIAIAGSHVLTVVFFYIKCRRSCENLSAWLAEIPSSTCTHQTLSHFNHLPKDKPSLFGNKKWIHWMWAETSNNIQQYPTITCQYAPHCTLLASSTINPCGGHCRHGIGIEATTHWCRSNHCCPQRSVARLGGSGTCTIINGCSSQPRQFFWRVSQHYPEYEADQSSRLSIYIYISLNIVAD